MVLVQLLILLETVPVSLNFAINRQRLFFKRSMQAGQTTQGARGDAWNLSGWGDTRDLGAGSQMVSACEGTPG